MRALKIIAFIFTGAVLVVAAAWFTLSVAAHPPSSDRFRLVFLGMTNVAGAPRVLLGFTNQSKSTSVWMTFSEWETTKGARPSSAETTNYYLTGLPPKSPVLLGPGQSAVFSIPAPPATTWRATARGFRADWRTQLRNWRIGHCPCWLDERLPASVRTGWSVEVWSDWIQP
jgi:hypothetical protein